MGGRDAHVSRQVLQYRRRPRHAEPGQKPRPPIWVGGFAKGATRRAARYGDGYIAINEVRPAYDNYVAELRALGKNPASAHVIAGYVWLVIANDPDKTWPLRAPHNA